MARSPEKVKNIITNYQKRRQIYQPACKYEVRKSNLEGLGIFAKEDIAAGETIFVDLPIVIGPRASIAKPVCVVCYKQQNLKLCENCNLPLCSAECQHSEQHREECQIVGKWFKKANVNNNEGISLSLLKCLTPIRSLTLNENDKEVVRVLKTHYGDQHGFEVDILKNTFGFEIEEDEEDFMRIVCSALDANAFEVTVGKEDKKSSLRGLYPLSSLANHNCTPNATNVFDAKQQMIVRASVFIPKNTEIFHSYTKLLWGTLNRRILLAKTKHFFCKCQRCSDSTEFGSYISALKCRKCSAGYILPENALNVKSFWICDVCRRKQSCAEVGKILNLLGSTFTSFDDNDLGLMLKFLEKLGGLVHENNQVVTQLKCKVIWIVGYRENYKWKEVPDDLLQRKTAYCRDILKLLEILNLGKCKIRGLMLYELYRCLQEIQQRKNEEITAEAVNLVDEAKVILKDDVEAPFL